MVRQRHLGGVGAADDVGVGDDVAAIVPDEARARAGRHLADVPAEDFTLKGRNVDDRVARLFVDGDGRLLILGQVAAWRYGTEWLVGIVQGTEMRPNPVNEESQCREE